MLGYINGFDYLNAEAQKYWSFPASYTPKKKQETLNFMLYSNDYIASEKRDGYFQFVIKDEDDNIFMRARNKGVNGWVCKQDWVPHIHDFFEALPTGTVLVCEIYIPGKTSKGITTILGCAAPKAIERQAKGQKLRLSVFDVIAYNGEWLHKKPIIERIKYLDKLPKHPYVDVVTYWSGAEDITENWLNILSSGGEGVVLTQKGNMYEFGKRTARHTLKLKKELSDTLDVFLTGNWKKPTMQYSGTELATWPYWFNPINNTKVFGDLSTRVSSDTLIPVTKYFYNDWAAAVEIAMIIDGVETPIGWISNISDEVREGIVNNSDEYKHQVVELQAMEIDTTGATPTLRHAKIINWRVDKNWEDCVWSNT